MHRRERGRLEPVPDPGPAGHRKAWSSLVKHAVGPAYGAHPRQRVLEIHWVKVLAYGNGVELKTHPSGREPQPELRVLACGAAKALVEPAGLADQGGLRGHVGRPKALRWRRTTRLQAGEPELDPALVEPANELRGIEGRRRDDEPKQRGAGLAMSAVELDMALDERRARAAVVAQDDLDRKRRDGALDSSKGLQEDRPAVPRRDDDAHLHGRLPHHRRLRSAAPGFGCGRHGRPAVIARAGMGPPTARVEGMASTRKRSSAASTSAGTVTSPERPSPMMIQPATTGGA